MNPEATTSGPGTLPPLADFRNNHRIRWYRCPIDPTTLRALSEPSDLRGLVQSACHLGIWIGTGTVAGYLFMLELWWGLAVALFLHGTVASFFSATHHELCHTTPFKTKWLNEFFLRIFSFLGWYKLPHLPVQSHVPPQEHAVPRRGSRGGDAGGAIASPSIPSTTLHVQRDRWISCAGPDSNVEEYCRDRIEPLR